MASDALPTHDAYLGGWRQDGREKEGIPEAPPPPGIDYLLHQENVLKQLANQQQTQTFWQTQYQQARNYANSNNNTGSSKCKFY